MSKIKNNEITHTSNSGTSNIVMDASGNVTTAGDLTTSGDLTTAGDLTVTGNDIKSSGATAITMSGANVTVAGTCTATGGFVGISSVCARNYITNGDMQVAQRTASFTGGGTTDISKNDDDDYTLDQWILLSDGNDIVDVTQSTQVPTTGATNSIALDVETANKKFGIFQPIESADCKSIIGGTASLSFKMKASAVDKLDSVKAAIISWSSTADSVTSDVVNAWGAEGTRPTLATNWTYENANSSGTTGNFTPTTSWATYTLKNVSIDTSSTTNVGVFIWSDVTDTTVGQFLYITDVQLESGADTNDYLRARKSDEIARCQRYFFAKVRADLKLYSPIGMDDTYGASNSYLIFSLPVEMRANPTGLFVNGTSYWRKQCHGHHDDFDTISISESSLNSIMLYNTGSMASNQGQGGTVWSANSNARLYLTAEL